MKSLRTLSILAATAFCLVANTSFAEYAIVTTKIIGLLPREKGLVIRIDAAGAQALQVAGVSCVDNSAPIFLLSKPDPSSTNGGLLPKPDYKTSKDALMLAYSLKKSITLYVEKNPTTANWPVCVDGTPSIFAIDVLEN